MSESACIQVGENCAYFAARPVKVVVQLDGYQYKSVAAHRGFHVLCERDAVYGDAAREIHVLFEVSCAVITCPRTSSES